MRLPTGHVLLIEWSVLLRGQKRKGGGETGVASFPNSVWERTLSKLCFECIRPPPQLVSWRSANWPSECIDSVLVLSFLPEPLGGRIELVHVNVPEEDFAGVSHGWEKYYWTPWRAHLDGARAT